MDWGHHLYRDACDYLQVFPEEVQHILARSNYPEINDLDIHSNCSDLLAAGHRMDSSAILWYGIDSDMYIILHVCPAKLESSISKKYQSYSYSEPACNCR